LKKNLAAIGTEVLITSPGGRRGVFGKLIDQSKILAPHANFNEAKSSCRGRFLYHGLSNINLPVFSAGGRRRACFVLTVHDLIPLLVRPGDVSLASRVQFALLLPKALKLADRIVVVSNWTRDTLLERFPFAASKTQVIPNGFPAFSCETPKPAEQPAAGPLRLLTVGRSEPYKRHRLFLEVIRLAAGTLKGVLVTAGLPAEDRALAEELVAQGSLDVVVNPSHDALVRLYRSTDIYLQTSLFEGFCLPAAEAQAFGNPVVFTSGSAVDEIVDPKGGKSLPPAADAREWLEAVQHTAESLPERRLAALAWANSRPHWLDAAKSLKNLYNSL
jgi:glycosyltransferase involved in cell wall biosynthesis